MVGSIRDSSYDEAVADGFDTRDVAGAVKAAEYHALLVPDEIMPEMFEQEPSGFLADIYVEEEYRHAGVGRALVDALAEWFGERGLRYFEWHVAARNTDGMQFWKALGGRDVMIRMRADVKPKGNGS